MSEPTWKNVRKAAAMLNLPAADLLRALNKPSDAERYRALERNLAVMQAAWYEDGYCNGRADAEKDLLEKLKEAAEHANKSRHNVIVRAYLASEGIKASAYNYATKIQREKVISYRAIEDARSFNPLVQEIDGLIDNIRQRG